MKFGLFLMPEPFPWSNWTLSYDLKLEEIAYAERFGYDEVWIGEHHTGAYENIPAPDIFIAKASALTSRIGLGWSAVPRATGYTIGVMARTIEDCALVVNVVSARALPDLSTKLTRAPRIGFCRTSRWKDASLATQSLLEGDQVLVPALVAIVLTCPTHLVRYEPGERDIHVVGGAAHHAHAQLGDVAQRLASAGRAAPAVNRTRPSSLSRRDDRASAADCH